MENETVLKTDDDKEKDSSSNNNNNNNNEIVSMVTQCVKTLACILLIYLMGYYGFSFSWIFLGVFVWIWRERYSQERNEKFAIARAFAIDEKKEITARLQFLPAWVLFPETERAEWVNKIIRQLWPFVGDYVKEYIRINVEPSLQETLKMSSFKFDVIDLGDVPLRVGGINVFREAVSRHEIIMDVELYYSGDCFFKVSMTKFKAGIKDIQFHAKVRVIMKPLVNVLPLVGGIQVYFLAVPDIHFNLTDIANFLDLPGFADVLRKSIKDYLCNMMLLPNKFTLKLINDVSGILLHYPEPKIRELQFWVLRINVIEARDLMKKDIGILGKSDPYCKISVAGHEFRTQTINNTVNPIWNHNVEYIMQESGDINMELAIFDYDQGNKDDDLGSFSLNIHEVLEKGSWENWVTLREADSGQVHVSINWFSLSSDVIDVQKMFEPSVKKTDLSNAVFIAYVDSANALPKSSKLASEPSPFARLSVGEVKHATDVQHNTHDPIWERGFCFLVKDPELQDFVLELVDKKTDQVLGNVIFPIRRLLNEEQMYMKLQPIPLKHSGFNSTVSLCLQLKAMVRAPIDTHQPEYHSPLPSPVESNSDYEKPPSLDEHVAAVLTPILKPLEIKDEVLDSGIRKRNVFFPISGVHMWSNYSPVHWIDLLKYKKRPSDAMEMGKFSVQLTLRYSTQKHMLAVVVHKVCNVPIVNPSDLPDPFVKLILLPDQGKESKRKTSIIKNNVNPVYDEKFEYTLTPPEITNRTLKVIVCSRSSGLFGKKTDLGKSTITDLSKATTEWYELENTDDDDGSKE